MDAFLNLVSYRSREDCRYVTFLVAIVGWMQLAVRTTLTNDGFLKFSIATAVLQCSRKFDPPFLRTLSKCPIWRDYCAPWVNREVFLFLGSHLGGSVMHLINEYIQVLASRRTNLTLDSVQILKQLPNQTVCNDLGAEAAPELRYSG